MKITKITTTVVNAKMRNWVVVRVYGAGSKAFSAGSDVKVLDDYGSN
jgi:hypothetical protein